MSDVKWIKIVTDIFDDEKMLLIEQMPEADSLIVIWFKLLCLAGKQNNSGVFILNDKIPYTDEMFATIFRRPLNTIRLALDTFEKFGMINVIDNTVTIPNWSKHQNLDKIEKNNKYMKKYMREYRERQKKIAIKTSDTSQLEDRKLNVNNLRKTNVSGAEKNKNRIDKNRIEYNSIVEIYNFNCPNLPQIKKLTSKRKTNINKLLKEITIEQFKEICKIANNCDFLIGKNNRNWKADFDFLIRPDKAVSILEGKYSNKNQQNTSELERWANGND